MSKSCMKKTDAVLAVIDFQERLMPAMYNREALEAELPKMIKGCRVMEVPILVTQQYTKGLGASVAAVSEAFSEEIADRAAVELNPIDKTTFSCAREPVFMEALENSGKKTVLITGIETHICVAQTVIDLLEKGYAIFVIADCVGSRKENDTSVALERMKQAGAVITTCEAALFELCGGAREPGFKEISKLIK